MVKPTFPKSAMPSCAKPSICRPQSPGAGADLSSPGSLSLSNVNSMIWPFAVLSCASFSTSLLAFLVTNNPLTPRLFLSLKPFDPQDRIYKLPEIVGRLGQAPNAKRETPNAKRSEKCGLDRGGAEGAG